MASLYAYPSVTTQNSYAEYLSSYALRDLILDAEDTGNKQGDNDNEHKKSKYTKYASAAFDFFHRLIHVL